MYGKIKEHLANELTEIEKAGLFKKERIITSPQGAEITLDSGQSVLNFCANNYLGLSSHPKVPLIPLKFDSSLVEGNPLDHSSRMP